MRTVTITIPRKDIACGRAKPVIDADGFRGTTCRDITKTFVEALGATAEETAKPEMCDPVEERLSIHE